MTMAGQQTNQENANANEENHNEELSETFGEDASSNSDQNENTSEQASTQDDNDAPNPANESAGPSGNEPQIHQLKDQLLRNMAELENTRRRHKQQLEDASKFAVSKFAKDLIEVVENLFRATNSVDPQTIEGNDALKNFYDGVEMTKKNLLATLERHGIERIAPNKGEPFNPNTHEAVAHVPSPDAEPGSVIDMVQAGYQIHERLLRPAMVAVAKGQE